MQEIQATRTRKLKVLQTYSTKNIFSKAYYSLAVRRQRDNSRHSKRNCQVTYKGILIRLTADLSAETLQTRNEWDSIFKVLKENIFQPRMLYPPRLSSIERETKYFSDKQKQNSSALRIVLQELLWGILYLKARGQYLPS